MTTLYYSPEFKRYNLRGSDPLLKSRAAQSGFYYDGQMDELYTHNALIALPFMHLLDTASRPKFNKDVAEGKRTLLNSHAQTAPGFNPPGPGDMDYEPYQKAAIAYCLQNHTRCVVGDDMGLGKTITAIGVINSMPEVNKVLIVTTASLKINWVNELRKWLIRSLSYQAAYPDYYPINADIVVINYELLSKYERTTNATEWDLIIADECQYVKNAKTKRGKAFFKLDSPYALGLSGTPIENRVKEIHSFLHYLHPDWFPSLREFEWCYNQSPEALNTAIRSSCFVRRLKSEVMKDLPPKRRQIIELDPGGLTPLIAEEMETFTKHMALAEQIKQAKTLEASSTEESRAAVKKLVDERKKLGIDLMKLRKQIGIAKIPFVIAFAKELLDSGVKKLIIFCHHHEVIHKLHDYFGNASVTHYGSKSPEDKQSAIDRFQSDDNCQVLIGGIKTAVGYTATAAQDVIVAEQDWVPAALSQAEDRANRRGQKGMVHVRHLVLEGSLDARMAKIVTQKQVLIENALGDKTK